MSQQKKGSKSTKNNKSQLYICSKNYSRKSFKDENFQDSQAGIKHTWRYGLITLFFALSILVAVAISIAIMPMLAGANNNLIAHLIGLIMLGIFFITINLLGFRGALLSVGTINIVALICLIPLFRIVENSYVSGVLFGIYSLSVAFSGIIMFAFSICVLVVITKSWIKYAATFVAMVVMVVSILYTFPNNPPSDILENIILTGIILAIGCHIARLALARDTRFDSIRLAAIVFCARFSTSFYQADLTRTDFTGAILNNVNFKSANLLQTRLKDVKGLEYAYIGRAYLQNPKIQQLAITLDTNSLEDKNFDYLDLEGINLENANLQDASFIGANFKNANLKGANLTGANLKQARLIGADLTGAILTGACIEDWAINQKTKLQEIKCDFIYLKCEEESNKNGYYSINFQERCPDESNPNFKEGDFTMYFEQALERFNSVFSDGKSIENSLTKSIARGATTINIHGSYNQIIETNQGGVNYK